MTSTCSSFKIYSRYRCHYITNPNNIKRKSVKFTSHLQCLIPANMGVLWWSRYFMKLEPKQKRHRRAGPWQASLSTLNTHVHHWCGLEWSRPNHSWSIAPRWLHVNCEQHSYDFQTQFERKYRFFVGVLWYMWKISSTNRVYQFPNFQWVGLAKKSLFNQHPMEVQEQTRLTMSDHEIKPSTPSITM